MSVKGSVIQICIFKSSYWRCSIKKMFLQFLQYSFARNYVETVPFHKNSANQVKTTVSYAVHVKYHYVKNVCIRSFFSSYFPAFGLNTERYSVFVYIQSLCAKIRTKKIPNTDTFHAVYLIRLITSNFFPPISVDSKKVN